jgi:16S rRNA (guanine966-N2)-methyltransferase
MGLRVIAGEFKGRRLATVPGRETRPTAERIREAVFNILGPLAGEQALDLFAGTGALGIEALSRGAAFALFVEKSPRALEVIRRNIRLCGISARSRVVAWDAARSLNCLRPEAGRFSLVLMDPPYGRGLAAAALAHLAACGCLARQARVVVERDARAPRAAALGAAAAAAGGAGPAFALEDERRYGRTVVSFLRYVL